MYEDLDSRESLIPRNYPTPGQQQVEELRNQQSVSLGLNTNLQQVSSDWLLELLVLARESLKNTQRSGQIERVGDRDRKIDSAKVQGIPVAKRAGILRRGYKSEWRIRRDQVSRDFSLEFKDKKSGIDVSKLTTKFVEHPKDRAFARLAMSLSRSAITAVTINWYCTDDLKRLIGLAGSDNGFKWFAERFCPLVEDLTNERVKSTLIITPGSNPSLSFKRPKVDWDSEIASNTTPELKYIFIFNPVTGNFERKLTENYINQTELQKSLRPTFTSKFTGGGYFGESLDTKLGPQSFVDTLKGALELLK